MWYGYLADAVVAFHLSYVSYVVVGQLTIWIGLLFKWAWVRNPWFRWTHMLAIVVVALEAVCNFTCPLTTWEFHLRRLAGQSIEESTFVGRLFDKVLFWDLPTWAFTAMYISFAVVTIATFVLAPPRWNRRHAHFNSVAR
jgi:hypothetical protein